MRLAKYLVLILLASLCFGATLIPHRRAAWRTWAADPASEALPYTNNLIAFYANESLSGSVGDQITTWLDSSTNVYSLQSDATKPILTNNVSEINGLNYAQFGASSYMTNTLGAKQWTNNTVFIICSPIAGADQAVFDSMNSAYRHIFYRVGTGNMFVNGGAALNSNAGTNGWAIWEILYNGANSFVFTNGTQTANGNAGNSILYGFHLNGAYTHANMSTSKVAEVILYNEIISDENRSSIRTYLSNKFF